MHDGVMEYEIQSPTWWRFSFREYWRHRELFYFLAWRDVLVKYKQTILGIVWAVVQPFALMVIFSVFWSRVIRLDTGILPYPLFACSGLILWGLFASGVGNSAGSMIENANLVKKVYFPRAIIPLSALVVAVFDFAITLIVYILLICYYGMASNLPALLLRLPLCLGIVLLSALGLGFAMAGANVRYRDFRYVVPFLLQALFFSTPVIFPVSLFDAQPVIAGIMLANPVSCAIELLRGSVASEPLNWSTAAIGLSVATLLFLSGFAIFKRAEVDCADIL